MREWFNSYNSYTSTNINGSKNSEAYSYENSNQHIKPIEKCYINGEIFNCSEKQSHKLELQDKTKKKNIVKNGEICNGSLPPQYATFCDKGLRCHIEKPMPGASGVCVPENSNNYKNKYLKYKKKYLKLIQKNLNGG